MLFTIQYNQKNCFTPKAWWRHIAVFPLFLGSLVLCQIQCPGDYNFDATVDNLDIFTMSGIWRDGTAPDPIFDLDSNGQLDVRDLTTLTNMYGPCGMVWYVSDCGQGSDPDCIPGDDSNDGQSPQTAWRTYDRAQNQWASLQPLDSIRLARGSAFTVSGNTRWVNSQSTALEPVMLTDYQPEWGSGDENRPIIWLTIDEKIFKFEDGGNAEVEQGYIIKNLDLRCTLPDAGQTTAFFFYNEINDVIIDNVSIDGFKLGIQIAGSNPCSNPSDPDCNRSNDRIILRNSRITNCQEQGFLGGGNNCVIENNHFSDNGGRAMFDHNIYYSGGTTDSRISGNTLYHAALDANGSCNAPSMVVHGNHFGLIIENNYIYEDIGKAGNGCWGIAVDPAYGSSESFVNITIRGNKVVNVGNVAIGTASCENCIIENNVIIQEQPIWTTAIAAPDRTRDSNDLPMTDVIIRNNSIFFSGSGGGTAILLGTEGVNHQVVNNAVEYNGTGLFNVLDLDLPIAQYQAVDHNIGSYDNTSNGSWEKTSGSLSTWQLLGFGLSSVNILPGFNSPSGPVYDLSASSLGAPIVDTGHPTLSSQSDISGNPRDATPDVGAYEH